MRCPRKVSAAYRALTRFWQHGKHRALGSLPESVGGLLPPVPFLIPESDPDYVSPATMTRFDNMPIGPRPYVRPGPRHEKRKTAKIRNPESDKEQVECRENA